MIPRKDSKGVVTVELTETEIKRVKACWPVVEQLAYHFRNGGECNGVDGKELAAAATTIASIVCDVASTEE